MSTASCGRSRSGDRFYNPPQVRRQLQLRQQQQREEEVVVVQKQNQEREEVRREKNHHQNHHQRRHKAPPTVVVEQQERVEEKSSSSSSENRIESDDCDSSTATTATTMTTTVTPGASVSSSSLSSSPRSTNLDRFLEYTTPVVPAQYFSKMSMKRWRTQDDEFGVYFGLDDLWESFREWSVYGAGVPLVLNGSNSVVQYYVPYLSGIQLYIDPSKPSPITRMPGEESDESSRETSSDGSSDSETERGPCNFSSWNQQDPAESNIQSMKQLSLRYKPLNCSSSDEGEFSSSPGTLTFEYFEHDRPYSREPLADKISLLASRFPELKTYRSCDLSPSSWVSVAWYPIYRIPTGPTLQNLDSCFLTFHCLSTSLRGGSTEWQNHCGSCPRENDFNIGLKIPLPIFGMASYKFKTSVWDQDGVDESPKANSLLRAADEWLRLLNVNHPDYQFFASHKFNWT